MNQTTIRTTGTTSPTPKEQFDNILAALINAQEWRFTDDEQATTQAVFHMTQALACFTR